MKVHILLSSHPLTIPTRYMPCRLMGLFRPAMAMLLACAAWLGTAKAAPGDLDPLNASIIGDYVLATAVQPDGKIIIVGNFTSVLGVPRNHIARLNANGTLDTGFNPNPNAAVGCVAVQADGKVLLGGAFTTLQPNGAASATTRNRIARVNSNGTLDTGFNPNAGSGIYDGIVLCMALQADGKVLLGGMFASLQPNGAASPTPRSYIARVNADGTLDTGFDPDPNNQVHTLAVQADGKVLLGGHFTTLQPNGAASATTRRRIARVNADGTLDTGFNPNANELVQFITVQADGKVLLGGDFTTLQPNGAANATTRQKIARVNTDGTLDIGYNPNANDSASFYSTALQADGKLLLAGQYDSLQANGAPNRIWRNNMARLNADGTVEAGFDPNASGSVWSVALQADGKTLAGGVFDAFQPNGAASPTARNLFARLENDAATQSIYAASANQVIWARGGGAPEVSQVTFELSTNGGASYFPLSGIASRVGATPNWRLSGVSLPSAGLLRARGRAASGIRNGSSGLIEQVATYNSFGAAEIAVSGNGVNIVDGDGTPSSADHTNFGSTALNGGSVTRTFTISNSGTASLNLTGTPRVVVSGAGAQDFAVTIQPGTPVFDSGGSTTFQVTFDPSVTSTRNAVLTIANDDADENPFNFTISGTGISAPEIALNGNGVDIADGHNSPSLADGTDFGSSALNGSPVTRVFTITNSGTSTLFLNGSPPVALSGSDNFMITQYPAGANISSGGTLSFEVTFYPTVSGQHFTTVSIGNNDSDENPFDFTLSGFVEESPTTIPDAALEAAIRLAINKPTDPITQSDMLALTSLDLRGELITDLSGLEFATNLRFLDLRWNNFSDTAALWSVLDQLTLHRLYLDLQDRRPNGLPAGRVIQIFDWGFDGFIAVLDPLNLPVLDVASMGPGFDADRPANQDALRVIAASGIAIDTGGANLKPAARASFSVIDFATREARLNAGASFDVNGSIASYQWNWPGGSVTGISPTATFPAGTTFVTLTVTDNGGQSSEEEVAVAFEEIVPPGAWVCPGLYRDDIPADIALPYVKDVTAICAGWTHTGALMAGGSALLWNGPSKNLNVPAAARFGVVKLDVSQQCALALRSDGRVVAWGKDYSLANVPVQAQGGVIAISAGASNNLVLKNDGSVFVWGPNVSGSTVIPTAAQSGVTAIDAGSNHLLALKNGSVIAWGSNTDGQCTVPAAALSGVTAIAAGGSHSLALKSGSVLAWGSNQTGQCTVPDAAQAGVVAIAAGTFHSLALKSDGSVISWGYEIAVGQPPPAALSGVVAIAAGWSHSVALKQDGTVIEWPTSPDVPSRMPMAIHPSVESISGSNGRMFAVKRDGTVLAWELFEDYNSQTNLPTAVRSRVTAIASGGLHDIALKQDGSAVMWRDQGTSQSAVTLLGSGTRVTSTSSHAWLLGPTGTVEGVYSSGDPSPSDPFNQFPEQTWSIADIRGGIYHLLGLSSDGAARVWLDPSAIGTEWEAGQQNVPAGALTNVTGIAAGSGHCLVRKSNGSVVAWGMNEAGQCILPGAAMSGVVDIAAGESDSCVLRNDGTVVAWGGDYYDSFYEKEAAVPGFAQGRITAITSVGRANFHRVGLPGAVGPSFAQSAAAAGLSGGDAAADAMPFGDGLTNLLKFAFNMNLAGPDNDTLVEGGYSGLPTHRIVSNGTSKVFRYEYVRRVNAGLYYTPRKRTDLAAGSWQPLASAPVIAPIDADWERVVYEEPATAPRCLFTVEVEMP